MFYLKTLAGLMIWLSLASGALAQTDDSKKEAENQRPASPREQVRRGFGSGAPKVGEMLPDVAGFDAQGKEFRLSSLRGHYSVLVFGCLT